MGWGQGSMGRGQWPESRGSGLNGWVQAPPLRACDGVMWLRGRTRPGPGLWTCTHLQDLVQGQLAPGTITLVFLLCLGGAATILGVG